MGGAENRKWGEVNEKKGEGERVTIFFKAFHHFFISKLTGVDD